MKDPHANPASQSSEGLLAHARGGSREALGKLLESTGRNLVRRANGEVPWNLNGKIDGTDLLQEVFVVAVRDFSQFHGATLAQFYAWVRSLLEHQASNLRRHFLETEMRSVEREESLDRRRRPGPPHFPFPADPATPEQVLIDEEEKQSLHRALLQLPRRSQEALALRFWENRSYQEIGCSLGISEEAARKLCERGIRQMAICWKE